MRIYLDVGNTRMKWLTDPQSSAITANTVAQLTDQWRAVKGEVNRIIACDVRGVEIRASIDKVAEQIFGRRVDWQVSAAQACGVRSVYRQAERLGTDRWAALVAARARYANQACIVVDAGSAITIDLLDVKGQHRGGVIMPGKGLMHEAIGMTAQLDAETGSIAGEISALASQTEQAIRSGIAYSIMGGVQAVIEQQAMEINVNIEDLPILITGGDVSIINLNQSTTKRVPNLVLEGLQILAECER